MTERTNGKSSVPQIFINNKFIGGCDELHSMEATGGLLLVYFTFSAEFIFNYLIILSQMTID